MELVAPSGLTWIWRRDVLIERLYDEIAEVVHMPEANRPAFRLRMEEQRLNGPPPRELGLTLAQLNQYGKIRSGSDLILEVGPLLFAERNASTWAIRTARSDSNPMGEDMVRELSSLGLLDQGYNNILILSCRNAAAVVYFGS